MRLIQEIPHEEYKISIFSWNNKYIIKFESNQLEQTYKISEWDLTSEDDILKLVNHLITTDVKEVFGLMSRKFSDAIENI
jgi:hypothetical protein